MKKFLALMMVLVLALSFTACSGDDPAAKSEGVMTYAEYDAADLDTQVTIEAYVQANQAWWDEDGDGVGTITLYLQDPDGAYFVYGLSCTKDDAAKMTKGTKLKVSGYKSAWAGEVETIDATYEIMDGSWIAEAADVTSLLANEAELIKHQNQFVSFKGMTVEAANDSGAAYLYKWDGSGQEGDDLYFNVSIDGQTYTFTVESYLCDSSSAVYSAVKNLKVGDVIDMEGFLYWYEGVNPHITSVTVK